MREAAVDLSYDTNFTNHAVLMLQVAKIVEKLHLLGALLIYLLSLTLQPPSPLISVASKTKKMLET